MLSIEFIKTKLFQARPKNVPDHFMEYAEIEWKERRKELYQKTVNENGKASQDACDRGLTKCSILSNKIFHKDIELAVNLAEAFSEIFLPLWFDHDIQNIDMAEKCVQESEDFIEKEINEYFRNRESNMYRRECFKVSKQNLSERMMDKFIIVKNNKKSEMAAAKEAESKIDKSSKRSKKEKPPYIFTETQQRIWEKIENNQGISAKQLQKNLDIEHSTFYDAIRPLKIKGFIVNPRGGRGYFITDKIPHFKK